MDEEKILSQSKDERILNAIIQAFYEDKIQLDHFKKSSEDKNKEIKDIMRELNIQNFETDNGLTAKITIQNRDKLDEEKTIAKLKELGLTSAIKTKEYLDMDELENLIYNQKLNPAELSDYQIKKEVVTLKVTERKK